MYTKSLTYWANSLNFSFASNVCYLSIAKYFSYLISVSVFTCFMYVHNLYASVLYKQMKIITNVIYEISILYE